MKSRSPCQAPEHNLYIINHTLSGSCGMGGEEQDEMMDLIFPTFDSLITSWNMDWLERLTSRLGTHLWRPLFPFSH